VFVEHVTRGVRAGAVAGLAFGLLVALVANPLIGFADAADGGHHEATGGDHHGGGHHDAVPALVTDAVGVVAGLLWGVLLGGVVFGAVFYLLEPVIPGTGTTESYLLGAAGFVTVSGAPWLVLPPRVGAETVLAGPTRAALYGGMMVAGALACLLAGVVYRRLAGRSQPVAVAAAAVPLALLAVPAALAPPATAGSPLSGGLSSGLAGLVLFGQVLLWSLLAATHARLRGRSTAAPSTDGAVAGD
jgi:hypothetical protein